MNRPVNILALAFRGEKKEVVFEKLEEQIKENTDLVLLPEMWLGDDYPVQTKGSSLLKEIAQKTNQVVSCGGGIVLREENVLEMKKSGKIILLTAKPETILERVSGDDNRPVLQGKKTVADISALMEKRRSKYEAAADFIVETDEKTVSERRSIFDFGS